MKKLLLLIILVALPFGFRCDYSPPKERPCLTCAEAEDEWWVSAEEIEDVPARFDTIWNSRAAAYDTIYWDYIEVPETTITITKTAKWQRRLDRWVCKVDTTIGWSYKKRQQFGFVEDWKPDSVVAIDTTWIPLAPVFVDTTTDWNELKIIIDSISGTHLEPLDWGATGKLLDSAVDAVFKKMNESNSEDRHKK